MKYYIYKITSPSNKIYIGQTNNPKIRFNKYKNLNCKSQVKLYNAIKKYKWENFTIEIIMTTEKNVDFYEKKFIKLYDSVNSGLNLEYGGNKNKILSDSTKAKMSKNNARYWLNKKRPNIKSLYWLGKKRSKEDVDKFITSHKGQIPWNKDKKLSKIHKNNIRNAMLGKIQSQASKDKRSKSLQGRIPWNKGLTKNTDIRVKKMYKGNKNGN